MITRRRFIVSCAAAGAGVAANPKLAWSSMCGKPIGPPKTRGLFVRTFPKARLSLDNTNGQDALKRLAEWMTSTPDADTPFSTNLFPLHTYFGQFVDHDLTWNRVAFDAPIRDQEGAANFRRPCLDLDSVYGYEPRLSCQFSGGSNEQHFILRPTQPSGAQKDVPFDGSRPIIGDRHDLRNAENLILRQLHVVFMRFHNKLINQLPQHTNDPDLPTSGTLFVRARKLATWTYQWLVWNDFLETIRATGTGRPLNRLDSPDPNYRLPLEFALAGFRFGHSMVRDTYALNSQRSFQNKPATLAELINRSKDSFVPLTDEFVIEWDRFSIGSIGRSFNAKKIDPYITPGLGSLPPDAFTIFSQPGEAQKKMASGNIDQNLPYRTLWRSARAELASGQQVAEELMKKDPLLRPIASDLANDTFLQDTNLTENTPLWYYILKEAQVTPNKSPDKPPDKTPGNGERLGRLGTHLVETAIEGALQNDKSSFLFERGSNWKPPLWIFMNGYRTLPSLIEWVS